jgi:hypothetical protein
MHDFPPLLKGNSLTLNISWQKTREMCLYSKESGINRLINQTYSKTEDNPMKVQFCHNKPFKKWVKPPLGQI